MKLSPRQLEIVVAVGRDGLTWEEAARHIGISMGTLQSHVSRIQTKMGDRRRPPRDLMILAYFHVVESNDRESPDV